MSPVEVLISSCVHDLAGHLHCCAEHFTAACERSGGLAVQLQRVHSDLASLIGDSRAAAAS